METRDVIDGRFRITGKLGAGGMGVVYRARDERLGREVAVKVLPRQLATDPERVRRFEQEARATAALNHPNILSLFDVGTHDGAPYLVTELLEGETVRSRMHGGAMAPRDALDLVVPIALGLASAHEKGIVHRDLKPENLYVTRDGTVKILDFGLARLMPLGGGEDQSNVPTLVGGTATGVVLGTVSYMAPEQVRGQRVDQRADIFSLGCVLYEMLAGRRPFAGETAADTMTAILRQEPPALEALVSGVPPALAQVLRRCLEKQPKDRFSSAHDLALALQALVSGLDMKAVGGPLVPPLRRRWRALAGIAAAAVVIVASVVVAVLRSADPGADKSAGLDPARVMVEPFVNLTSDPELESVGAMAADAVTQGLVEVGSVEVMRAPPGAPRGDDAALRKAARAAGAGTVVSGSTYLSGDTLELRARVADVATGTPIFALKPERGQRGTPEEPIDRVRQRVMSALSMHLGRAPSLGGVTTPPLYAAYQEFMTGASLMGVDQKAVLAHLERAMALDPEFWHPQIRLMAWYRLRGHDSKADAMLLHLRQNQDKLGPADRVLMQYYEAFLAGRKLEAYRKARELLAIAPRDPRYTYGAAKLAVNLGRPREALECVGDLETIDWDTFRHWMQGTWLLGVAALAHHLLGEYEPELAVAEFGVRLYPDMLNVRQDRVRALAALGRLDELDRTIADSLAIGSRTQTPGQVMLTAAEELRAHGHPDDSRRVAAQGAEWYEGLSGSDGARLSAILNRIECLWLAEQWEEARTVIEGAVERDPSDPYLLGYRAIVTARLGDTASARSADDELARLDDVASLGENSWLRACIAAQLGERDRAVELLREALAHGFTDFHSLHVYAFLEPLHGFSPFEELITPKD